MRELLETPLSLFTGKGGVGKSTVVAALAVQAARAGRSPLIVELGHRASMQAIFGTKAIGHDPTPVAPGVHAINFDLDRALADYVRSHVPVRAIAGRIARSRALSRFFYAAPAVAELLTLWHLEALLAEGRWDPILVDFDSTGHATMFLELPRVFEGLAATGPMRGLLDSLSALLSDASRTRLHVVTLPGRLPVEETLELAERVAREQHVALGALFVNRVPDPPVPDGTEHILADLTAHPVLGDDAALAIAATASYRAARAELGRLRRLGLPIVELPRLRPPIDARALAVLGSFA